MDKAKILRLCNEIEDVACDIARITMNDIVSAESRMIFDKAKEIATEITAPPKTNADRIRQMTDEELAEWFAPNMMCNLCDKKDKPYGCNHEECVKYALIYMKKAVSEDACQTD